MQKKMYSVKEDETHNLIPKQNLSKVACHGTHSLSIANHFCFQPSLPLSFSSVSSLSF